MVNEIYKIENLAKDLELDCVDITDLYITYLDEIDGFCQKLRESFGKKDFEELRNQVHDIRGVAGNLLIQDVFEEATTFGRLLKDGVLANANEHVENLVALLSNSKIKVEQSFAEINITL